MGPTLENLDLPGSPARKVMVDPEEELGNGSRTEEPKAPDYQLDDQAHSDTEPDAGSQHFKEGDAEDGAEPVTEEEAEAAVNISPSPFEDQ